MGWDPPPPEGTTTTSPTIPAPEDLGVGVAGRTWEAWGAGWGREGHCEPGSMPSPPTRGSKMSGCNFMVTCQWATKFIFHLNSIHNVL